MRYFCRIFNTNNSIYRAKAIILIIIFTTFSCKKKDLTIIQNTSNTKSEVSCLYSNYFSDLIKKELITDYEINNFFLHA